MIIYNAAYYANSEIDLPNLKIPLLVTSAGESKLEKLPRFDTIRPNGRRDFQVIYIKSGTLRYWVDEEEYAAPENSVLFYHPNVPQFYSLFIEDPPDVYWIHFTGNNAEDTLKNLDLFNEMKYHVSADKKYEKIFLEIISELKNKSSYYVDICSNNLQKLLFLIARNRLGHTNTANQNKDIVDEIIFQFNTYYSQHFDMNEISNKYNISATWLTRIFNKYTGMSPQKYLNQVRMNKAKELLSKNESVSNVAFAIGYNDPLYFSRIFKKITGVSPSDFRKKGINFKPSTFKELPWYEPYHKN